MADEYIKRKDAVIKAKQAVFAAFRCSKTPTENAVYEHIDIAFKEQYSPSADVVEVKRGVWVEKPHWVPLPWDCEPSVSLNPDDYDKKTHSEKQMWWHCSCCDYSPYRWEKPLFNFCPNCGADMRSNAQVMPSKDGGT